MRLPLFVAAALGVALALTPTTERAFAQDGEAASEPAKAKKICRSYKVTGSLTRRTRVCRTETEWREADAAVHKGVSDMQGSASGAGRCIGLNCDAVPGR